ncbi:TolC family protein [Chitinophagaceae bacterium MMS25-I14]
MIFHRYIKVAMLFAGLAGSSYSYGQNDVLTLSGAIETGLANYNSIKAKANYARASQAMVSYAKRQYLPDVIGAVQNDYGTANSQFGPSYAYKGVGLASSGPVGTSQSWNAAYGGLYGANINWDVYNFGKMSAFTKIYQSQAGRDSLDLQQERFIHTIKVSNAYFNLLAAQKFVTISEANLSRVTALQSVVFARTKSGLNAGVDSSIANAELSNARLSLIDAQNLEQQASNQLAVLLNTAAPDFSLDTFYFANIPQQTQSSFTIQDNPTLKYFQSRVTVADYTKKYLSRSMLPTVSIFGGFQSRASGFDYDYIAGSNKYNSDYATGINPTRSNYLIGAGIFWNFMSPFKISPQVKAQKYTIEGLKNEYDLVQSQLKSQLVLADQRIDNAMRSYNESPIQLKAARDAYNQKSVLYKNGLANIVDLTQALYILNRAETNISVAYTNVWQALVLKAATTGDVELITKQAR